MPIALTAELRNVTLQFMVWDTGSGDIDIFIYRLKHRKYHSARVTAIILNCEQCFISETKVVLSLKRNGGPIVV